MTNQDAYRWISPFEEIERIREEAEWAIRDERKHFDDSMRRMYRSMCDENHRDRAHLQKLMDDAAKVKNFETPSPLMFFRDQK